MVPVSLGQLTLRKGDGPFYRKLLVCQVHKGVRFLELLGPVGIDEIRVHGPVFQRLEGIAHTSGNEDGFRGIDAATENPPKALPGT